MKSFAGLLAAALAATPASAHYIFQQLAVGDTEFAVWEHSMSILSSDMTLVSFYMRREQFKSRWEMFKLRAIRLT